MKTVFLALALLPSLLFASGGVIGNNIALSRLHPCANGQSIVTVLGVQSCATPAGGGDVTSPGSATVAHDLSAFADTSGTALEDSGLLTSTVITTTNTKTLTNKTLTAPVIGTITNTGTLTLPTSTDTLVGRATTDTLTNKTLTSPVIGTITNTGTLTLPTATTTLVGRTTTDTLTNKTLTAPVITTPTGFFEVISGMFEAPTDKTYVLDQSAAYAYTINTIIVATVSGTTTLAVKIGSTSVTGISAVSVSSTPATGTATAANSVSIGDKVSLVLSSSSSPVDLSFTLKYTR